eukprot:6188180-Pleurochrysis_carterae.AAC.2
MACLGSRQSQSCRVLLASTTRVVAGNPVVIVVACMALIWIYSPDLRMPSARWMRMSATRRSSIRPMPLRLWRQFVEQLLQTSSLATSTTRPEYQARLLMLDGHGLLY